MKIFIKSPYFIFLSFLFSCSHAPYDPHFPYPESGTHKAQGKRWVLAAQGTKTSEAGKEIFLRGGNAVDAAVAMSFAHSVERPQSTGLGGGGFMLIHVPGLGIRSIDFREKAPASASRNMYLDDKGEVMAGASLVGEKASGVPGLVAGLWAVHREYGKLRWPEVLGPAIKIAEEGFPIYKELALALEEKKEVLEKFPSTKKIFFKSDSEIYTEGEILIQKDLAQSLKLLAKRGAKEFYRGGISKKIVAQFQEKNHISKEDLKNYRVRWRKPLKKNIFGKTIYTMGPPSSGGIHVIQILRMLEMLNAGQYPADSWQAIHLRAQAMQRAFADRAEFLGDQDFVKVPVAGLMSEGYLRERIQSISLDRALSASEVGAGNPTPYESSETAHLSTMDAEGWAVATTQTINGFFGSGLVVEGTGILMNNEMDDFSAKPGVPNLFGAIGGEQNAIAPGKRPLSSMSPTIVLDKSRPILALGSPSGTRIINCVAQVLEHTLLHNQPLAGALSFSRVHQQWLPDTLRVEEPFWDSKTMSKLEDLGYKLEKKSLGCRVQAVHFSGHEVMEAVSDPRGFGLALGE